MRIARGGGLFIAGALGFLLAAVLILAAGVSVGALLLGVTSLTALLLLLWFFRDPSRNPPVPLNRSVALAPADGRVIEAIEGSLGARVTIYLNLLNVHVTRLPLDSEIIEVHRIEGTHHPASGEGARHNARVVTQCRTDAGAMQIVQIVGFLARRIVPYLKPGQSGQRGTRLGLIRFGSRVEVDLPPGYRLLVEMGTVVRAGETPVAEPSGEESDGGGR